MLGYGYLAAVVAVLAVLFTLSLISILYLKVIGIKIAIVIGAFLWVVLKAMQVKILPPEGRLLHRHETPDLFALVDSLSKKLQAPNFHHILITTDFNAAVVQVPRLGMLGWYRNYLLIGLPLMKSLTKGQFEAVLAHEFGHLAGGHGRISNHIYRLRMAWARLLQVLEANKSAGTFMFKPFFNWYIPYFNAYSFPLARANEYEADAISARIASPQLAAQALTAVNVIGSFLAEKYWPDLHKQADNLPQPAFAPYAALSRQMETILDDPDARAWLDQALAAKTTSNDTHPSLIDRLKAIGEQPCLARPTEDNAADRLLGNAQQLITEEFDRQWHETISPAWKQRYEEVRQGRQRLAELDELVETQEILPIPEAVERARLTEAFGAGEKSALEQFRLLLAREPDNPDLKLALGSRLLAVNDAEGFSLVESSIGDDPERSARCCELLRDFCWRNERKEEAHDWHNRFLEHIQVLQNARAERSIVRTTDKFDTHGLAAGKLGELQAQLKAIEGVRKVYFVRKRVKNLPNSPLYVLGFRITPWWKPHSKKKAIQMQARILESVTFPGETLVLNTEGQNYQFGRKFRFMRGSRIL